MWFYHLYGAVTTRGEAEDATGVFVPRAATAEFAEVSKPERLSRRSHDITRLIEAEKDGPLADAQAIPPFTRPDALNIAATSAQTLPGLEQYALRRSGHVGEFPAEPQLIDRSRFTDLAVASIRR